MPTSVTASMKKVGNLNEGQVSEIYLNMSDFVKLLWNISVQV